MNTSTVRSSVVVAMLLSVLSCQEEPEQIVETKNSSSLKVYAGTTRGQKDGPRLQAQFELPIYIAAGPDKSLYIVESTIRFSNDAHIGGSRVRKISPEGTVSTIFDLEGGNFEDNVILGIAVDKQSDIFISLCCTKGGNVIKKISRVNNDTSTVAGGGVPGTLSDGPALKASFINPRTLVFDKNGCLYIMDSGNNAVRLLTGGKVSTLAGGNRSFDPNGGAPRDGLGRNAEFDNPRYLTVDEQRNVYVAGGTFPIVRKVTPAGAVTTILGFPHQFNSDIQQPLRGIAGPRNGLLYVNRAFHDVSSTLFMFYVHRFTTSGSDLDTMTSNTYDIGVPGYQDNENGYPNPMEDGLNDPAGMVIVDNTLYICSTAESRIRKIDLVD